MAEKIVQNVDVLSPADLEIIETMIQAHMIQFGKRPSKIIIPAPTNLMISGVPIRFHHMPQYFSMDEEHCFHHHRGISANA